MSRPLEVLTAEILDLPNSERIELLDRLVASLDDDRARDLAWDRLAAEREVSLEASGGEPKDGPDTIARLRAAFKLEVEHSAAEQPR